MHCWKGARMLNKDQYLSELEVRLQPLGRRERLSAMEYWTEYIEDAGEEDWQEVAGRLGSPRELAARILREAGIAPEESPRRRIALWVLTILGSPLWLCLLAAGILLVAAAAMVALCAVFTFMLALGCGVLLFAVLMLGGVLCVICGAAVLAQHMPTAVFFIGVGLMLAAGGTAGMLTYLPVIARPWHACLRAFERIGQGLKAMGRKGMERWARR